ncbi:hypothetical protein CCH79_00002492 [Gambusia affinis]|uniref:Fatty acid hydroxylase domain-containing protein n=1 Tax=Gambusia affinis TaxID=33528 RepID=A0A315VJM7_GAMAF|nr:hypothetical protein CCH79_00002492 [Gambusia affinis]
MISGHTALVTGSLDVRRRISKFRPRKIQQNQFSDSGPADSHRRRSREEKPQGNMETESREMGRAEKSSAGSGQQRKPRNTRDIAGGAVPAVAMVTVEVAENFWLDIWCFVCPVNADAALLFTALVCFPGISRRTVGFCEEGCFCHRIWNPVPGCFWKLTDLNLWTKVYLQFEGHDAALFFLGTMLAPTLMFWLLNGLLLLVDTSGKPSFITRYRIQEGRNDPVDPAKLRQAVRTVLFNQVMISGPMVVLVYLLASRTGRPCGPELPTFHRGLMELAVFSMLEEILLFHHPSLYKHFHKQHHEWTAPIGVISIYAHPLEHISNMLPVVIGPVLLGSHITTTSVWYCLALVSTTISHCGYHLPFLPSPEFHDFHHLRFNQCFGVFGVLDRLHGTDSRFRQTKQYERHTLLTSLTPLTHSIPETPKKGQ